MSIYELLELLDQQPDKEAPVVVRDVDTGSTWVLDSVNTELDWREPAEYITFIDF